ncbi:MAG: DUF1801 domain-containing protein [Acidobacteriota bacterium]|nr:DUF1801 domain-containing protein [Acidobacteriota bacterium]
MPPPTPRPTRTAVAADTTEAVDRFMATLEHPHKDAIQLIRRIICSADPAIAEGVKWNAPSFRTTGYFATTQLRTKEGIGIVMHLGAKVREVPAFQLEDPQGLLKWLAKDRALMNFAGIEDVKAHEESIQQIVRQWIAAY